MTRACNPPLFFYRESTKVGVVSIATSTTPTPVLEMCVSTDEGSKESKTEISKEVVGSYLVAEVVDHHACVKLQWTESLRLKSAIENHLYYLGK